MLMKEQEKVQEHSWETAEQVDRTTKLEKRRGKKVFLT